MRYLVDSDRLVDALLGLPAAVSTLERVSEEGVGVSIVSYGEIFEGTFGVLQPAERLATFRAFLSRSPALPLSDPIMELFARHRARLRQQGQLIPDFDLAIAATAIHHDLTLVIRNLRHFARILDLRLYEPR